MAQSASRVDPYRSFNFRLEIDNTTVAAFSEVSGLLTETDTVDYREGTDKPNSVRKLAGLTKVGVFTLKRGYTKDTTLWDWHTAVLTGGATARRNGAIVLCDETQTDVLIFNFTNALLRKVEVPHMMASGNEVAIESAEIVPETLTIKPAQ
jgi:phage tail-like protein